MSYLEARRKFLEAFPYKPTPGQQGLISKLLDFVYGVDGLQAFVLKGFAGTGKTSIVSALVHTLPYMGLKPLLMAPTGRAAKVLSSYSGHPAFTIHKMIYQSRATADGHIVMALQSNRFKKTVFIVDEASMIQTYQSSTASNQFSSVDILEDLFQYVFSGDDCKLLLIGDTAQLPPVGMSESPALNMPYLKSKFSLNTGSFQLTEVVRQEMDSGILMNATSLRNKISNNDYWPPLFHVNDYNDICSIDGMELEDHLNNAFSGYESPDAVVICRSNKRANIFNQEIRRRILFREEEVSGGDRMMVVRNNYFWIDKNSPAGFIANGDILEVHRIIKHHHVYGFHFVDVSASLPDYPDMPEIEVRLLLDAVMADSPSLNYEQMKKLFDAVMEDYADIPSRSQRMEKVRNNPFFNALQVKFAYALTCHKTQGGQWDVVFIDQGFVRKDNLDKEYFRWLYTAVTRAVKKVFLVNFNHEFFG